LARNFPVPNLTIRGQITGVILICLLIVIFTGSTFERWVKKDYDVPDVEQMSEQVVTLAAILAAATDFEREQIIAVANRSGLRISLQPLSWAERLTISSPEESFLHVLLERLFPPDNGTAPIGGWRTFLDGKRVIAARVDADKLLVREQLPEGFLRSDALSFGSNYLVALVTLIILFSGFAVWAITRPLRRIAAAAANADLSLGPAPFKEEGSVEIVSLARALNGMQRRISTMVEARTRMLRGISHDLRTPLTRLRLRAERVEQQDVREALLGDVERIDRLLTESLSYLRDGHQREASQRADLASVLQTVCSEFADTGHQVDYGGPAKLVALFRPLAITRAVTNLCDNATKFGEKVEVSLRVVRDDLWIEVVDNGPGIPLEHRARVFEPFYKVDAARGGNTAGFGLGLSIVSEIIQSHRGTLELLDRDPTGLKVRVIIPWERG
jgi:signal transduction histidine kinase